MSLEKDSTLPAASTLTGTEIVAVVQGGASKRTTAQEIADLGSGAGGYTPTAALGKTVIAAGVGGSMEYKCEPVMVECPSGDIMCVYRRGSGHVNNDGKLVFKKSANRGVTWGTEADVYDHSSYDTRNQAIGINPDTGRIFVFFRVLNAPSTTVDIMVTHTDDEGTTWSAPTSVNSALPFSGAVPFGPMVKTSRGLTMAFYLTDQLCTLCSSDNGASWGNAVTVFNTAQSADFVEPTLIALDDDRLVVLVRLDGLGKDGFCYGKSEDGGASFGSFSAEVAYTSLTISSAACPIYAVKIDDGSVGVCWFGRYQFNRLIYVRIALDAFWEDPSLAWILATTYPTEPKRVLATPRRRFGTVTTATDTEFGYAFPLAIAGQTDRILIAWYDTGDGTNTNCSIYCIRSPIH